MRPVPVHRLMIVPLLANLLRDLERLPETRYYGRVGAVLGMLVEVGGVPQSLSIGGRCNVVARDARILPCEVIGFRNGRALAMPYGPLDGIGLGCKAEIADAAPVVYPHLGWLGRVVNALGEPVDGKGPLPQAPTASPVNPQPTRAHE